MNLLVLVGILVACIINCFNSFVGYVPVKAVESESVEVGEAVPILMFHHFVTDEKECDSSATITDKKFQEVLNEIEELGYETISFKDLIDFTEYKKELPDKPILITMDDGYKSNYEIAFPLLKEKNMKATVSIIGKSTKYTSSYLKNKTLEHMSWEELQRMREKKHHLCRGQKIIIETMQRPEGRPTARMIKVRTKYYVVEFYKHCILLRDKKGILTAPPYTKLKLMMQGAEADE